ncbi:DNA-directed RNA polymerase subunit beta' [Streptococcus pyogenes]|nr:DNA-directed RNA polymerase subunit beta' [Streptococcus pyogenes]
MLSLVKFIPAGTGMARYRNIEPQAMNEIEVIDHTEVSAEAVFTAEAE